MKRHNTILDRERAAAIVRASLWTDAQDIVEYLALERLIENPVKALLDAVFEGTLYKLTLAIGETYYDLYAPAPGAQKLHNECAPFFIEPDLTAKTDAFALTIEVPWDTREGIEWKILQDMPGKQDAIKARLNTCLQKGYVYRLTLVVKNGASFSLYAFSPRLLLTSMTLTEIPGIQAFFIENFEKYDEQTFTEMLRAYIEKDLK